MKKLILSIFTFLSLVCAPVISAAEDVKIGVLYPLTGPVAQVGKDAVSAVKTALDIINNSHDIPGMPLAKNAGLKSLGGAKISIVVGDHGGKPDIGVGETEKMLNTDKCHAMYGAYYTSVTGAASQVSERAGIPWVNGESTSPKLTTRGFKYFFRVTPHDGEFTQLMFEFMDDFNSKNNNKLKTVGIIHEDTLWGADSGGTQKKWLKTKVIKLLKKLVIKQRQLL
jgi:branched-chain amino acid transport system substrate-binding protein